MSSTKTYFAQDIGLFRKVFQTKVADLFLMFIPQM